MEFTVGMEVKTPLGLGTIKDMKNDFNDKINQEPTYFNKEAVEEYINKCIKTCTEEFFAQQNAEHKFNPKDYVWENKA